VNCSCAPNERGFSLVEVMFSIVVAGIVMLALGGMLIMSINTNRMSEHRMEASAYAQAIMSMVDAYASIGAITSTSMDTYANQLLGSNNKLFTPTVTVTPLPKDGYTLVKVELSWKEQKSTRKLSISSAVAQ